MLALTAKIRQKFGKETQKLRNKGIVPAVLYGPKIKNMSLEIDLKEFEPVYEKTGESSLISLEVASSDSSKETKKFLVLIHRTKRDPLTGNLIHVDFYQPILTEEIEVSVPLLFEGEAPAVKDLGGTLIKGIQEVAIKALPQNLPHEIKVSINGLKTIEDEILIKDLQLPENVKIQRNLEEVVATVALPEKIEEELEQPAEEKEERGEGTEEAEKKDEGKEEETNN
jgi:large subunit ribosomal protein L25